MPDMTTDDLRTLARAADIPLLDEDVEPLTLRLNALLEAMGSLDDRAVDSVTPLPALPHPNALPAHDRGKPAPPLQTETDAPLAYKPITELAHLIRTKQISPVELTEVYLERVAAHDDLLKSYITVTRESALLAAREAEEKLASSDQFGPLHGIPLAHKDEFYTKGILTTCGASVLSDFVPDFDATAVAKLDEAGAIMLGKLNMTEWATPLTLRFPYGQPRNPWNTEHDAGGSSTGSGIAVAAGLCGGSLGEDTGGSIRRPANHNSCVGLRPSWGRVSMHGVIPGVWYQDTAGPLTRTVADCALLMNIIAGYDPADPTTADLPVPDYTAVLDGNVRGMRIGIIREIMEASDLNPEVKQATQEAVQQFEKMGAKVDEVSLPLLPTAGAFNNVMGAGRAALQWSHLRHRPQDYDTAVRRYAVLPALLPAWLYHRAHQLRSLLRTQVLEAFQRYDVLVSPCQPAPPPRIEDTKKPLLTKEQAVAETRRFSYGAPATYAGLPAISVPCGFSQAGLPIGLQIMARPFDEEAVFRAAHAYEQSTPWHTMRPPVGETSAG